MAMCGAKQVPKRAENHLPSLKGHRILPARQVITQTARAEETNTKNTLINAGSRRPSAETVGGSSVRGNPHSTQIVELPATVQPQPYARQTLKIRPRMAQSLNSKLGLQTTSDSEAARNQCQLRDQLVRRLQSSLDKQCASKYKVCW